jgi:hypothetical protein
MYRAYAQSYPFRVPSLTSEIEVYPRSSTKQGPGMKISALWDTGATRTFISMALIDILIGMDIIQLGDFHISNTGGNTCFSFVIPSLPVSLNLADEAEKLNKQTGSS